MKKYILILTMIGIATACSSRKKAPTNAFTHSFLAYYNTLFNGKEALGAELASRTEGHQDNFYQPYIQLFIFDNNETLAEEQEVDRLSQLAAGFNKQSGSKGATPLQIAEAKALKAIEQHSVIKNGIEKNKTLFDAYLVLAKARMYQGKYLEALDAINTLLSRIKEDKRIPLARIYEARLYTKMKDFYRANEIFVNLSQQGVPKKYLGLYYAFYAENLLAEQKKIEAAEALADAYTYNKNRNLRSRIAFLRGQILADLGESEAARESFRTAYQKSNNFEFEVKSQIEIAKTFNPKIDDYTGAIQYLEKIAKKGTYASRKNEFYYALGLMAQKAGKEKEAEDFFRKALREKVSDPQIRGLTYFEIAQDYLKKNDYISAGAYYDSAVSAMTCQPQKQEVQTLASNIKKIAHNYYLIKKNDSVLSLTQMNKAQQQAFFAKRIEQLKAQEEKENIQRQRAEKAADFTSTEFTLANAEPSNFLDFGGKNKGFYFANIATVAKGEASFKQIWGDRALADNWRYAAKVNTIQETKDKALGQTQAKNPRRFETEFYIEQIPTDAVTIAQLKKDRDTASLGLGMMYEDYFSNTPLATQVLKTLVESKPDEETELQALYQIFSINYDKNSTEAEWAKVRIIKDFPYTPYAAFVKDPKRGQLVASSSEVEQAYTKAYELYKEEKYEASVQLLDQTISGNPNDALVPKLSLLKAYNIGKTVGKEVMILQLQQLALNYEKLPEGKKAQELLYYLKGESSVPGLSLQPNKSERKPDEKRLIEQPKIEIDPRDGVPVPPDLEVPVRKSIPKNQNLPLQK